MASFTATIIVALALLVPTALGAPAPIHQIQVFSGPKNTGSYIVKLKDGVAKDSHLSWLTQHLNNSKVTHDYTSDFLNGFAGKFDDKAIAALRASPDVESISEDGIMHTMATVTQTNAPWGISRISQNARQTNQDTNALTFTYKYDSSAGSGVDIYVVDTGIYTAHSQFGGRARWGATFGGYANADGNGHGTHCSGTAAGSQYGVAKSASLIAVKVLSDAGSGAVSDIASGLNWVLTQARASGRPSIVSMSLGGGASTALDNAVASLTGGGVHVVVAAGNDGADAGSTSPARAPSAITVGATTIADARASFSNYGAVVDIFAPGQYILSSWIGGTTATNIISGTSMATPHVAGLVAYLISHSGNRTPAAMATYIKSISLKGIISGVPAGTLNDFARNDI